MAFFGKLFGTQKSYPPLEPDNQNYARLQEFRRPLETLADEVNDQLEVLPGDKAAYVFIGKPPKKFGIAWIRNGEVFNFKKVAEKQAVTPVQLQKASEHLRSAYERSQSDTRYSTQLGDRTLVVADSKKLKGEVSRIIGDLAV